MNDGCELALTRFPSFRSAEAAAGLPDSASLDSVSTHNTETPTIDRDWQPTRGCLPRSWDTLRRMGNRIVSDCALGPLPVRLPILNTESTYQSRPIRFRRWAHMTAPSTALPAPCRDTQAWSCIMVRYIVSSSEYRLSIIRQNLFVVYRYTGGFRGCLRLSS